MHVFGEINGVKFRVNCDGPPSLEVMNAIKKMVQLVSKPINTEHEHTGKTNQISEVIPGR